MDNSIPYYTQEHWFSMVTRLRTELADEKARGDKYRDGLRSLPTSIPAGGHDIWRRICVVCGGDGCKDDCVRVQAVEEGE